MAGAVSAYATPIKTNTESTSQASAPVPVQQLPGSRFGVLGSLEFKVPAHKFSQQWTNVVARAGEERLRYAACTEDSAQCPAVVLRWRRMLETLRDLPQRRQLALLNARINDLVTYSDDDKAYDAVDHWASPVEFMTKAGDCEDYAILKFFSLLELGFSNDQLRVAIVRDTRRKVMHAVTTVELNGRTFVLDNLYRDTVQHQNVMKYMPVYSANLTAQWAHIVTRQIRVKFANATARRLAALDREENGNKEARLNMNRRARGELAMADTPVLERMREAEKSDALRAAWT